MIPKSVGGDIRISVRGGLALHSGDLVSVNVLKPLAPHKWAVGVQGRVLPAFSHLDLEPGTSVRARVTIQGKSLLFTILPDGKGAARAPGAAAAALTAAGSAP